MHTFCACVVSMHTMYVCYASHAFICLSVCLSVCLSFCLFVCLSVCLFVVCPSLFLSFYICVLCGEDVLWINEYVNKYCICRLSVFSMNLLCGCVYSVLPFFLSFCPCMCSIYAYYLCISGMYVCILYIFIYIYIHTYCLYLPILLSIHMCYVCILGIYPLLVYFLCIIVIYIVYAIY